MPGDFFRERTTLGLIALAVLGLSIARSVPDTVSRSLSNLVALSRNAGESEREARVRVRGESYVAGIEAVRRRIPETESYFLVDAAVGTADVHAVRHDLAPRTPIFLGSLRGPRDETRDLVFPARPPGAPATVVIVRRDAAPELVSTDDFLGRESIDPGREDESIPASIDQPAEGARLADPVLLSGWCQEIHGRPCASVLVFVDGARVAGPVERFPRPDVAAAVPEIGDCARAGWRVTVPLSAPAGKAHQLSVFFLTSDGRYRRLGPVRFWRAE